MAVREICGGGASSHFDSPARLLPEMPPDQGAEGECCLGRKQRAPGSRART